MQPQIKVLTLGVNDLETSLAFYRDGLGWATEGIVGTEFEGGAVVFFALHGGLILALYPKTQIAKDANLPFAPSPIQSEVQSGANMTAPIFTLGHNVNSKAEVDAVMAEAQAAGAAITDPPRDRAWGGYSGHFLDPDGHVWEIVWNPQLAG